jgi:adenylate cyclase
MDGFTREELAGRAGVSVGYIDHLIELGILTASAADAPFSAGDVRRVRFIHGLEEGGLPLEGMGAAVRSGDLSFRFFDTPAWDRFGGMSPTTFRELSAQTGIGLDLLQSVRESIGFARPGPDDHLREDELDQVALVRASLAAGVDPGAVEQLMRVWGESVRRITDAEANFYHSQIELPLLRSGLSESQMMEAATTASASIGPLLDRSILGMYHAQSEHTWMALVVEAVEATLERAGLYEIVAQAPAMCFLDLSGYTRLTEERGDQAAAEMAASLGRLVQHSSHEHGGRPVKWLGDGVMVYFRQPGQAVAKRSGWAAKAAARVSARRACKASPLSVVHGLRRRVAPEWRWRALYQAKNSWQNAGITCWRRLEEWQQADVWARLTASGMVDPTWGRRSRPRAPWERSFSGGGYSARGGVTILSSRPDVMFPGEWVVHTSPSMGSVTAYAICAFVS